MEKTDAQAANRCLSVLAVLGLTSVVALFVNDGLDVDGLPGGARLAGVILLGVCLAVGLQVRAKEPSESMVLLVVGSFALDERASVGEVLPLQVDRGDRAAVRELHRLTQGVIVRDLVHRRDGCGQREP